MAEFENTYTNNNNQNSYQYNNYSHRNYNNDYNSNSHYNKNKPFYRRKNENVNYNDNNNNNYDSYNNDNDNDNNNNNNNNNYYYHRNRKNDHYYHKKNNHYNNRNLQHRQSSTQEYENNNNDNNDHKEFNPTPINSFENFQRGKFVSHIVSINNTQEHENKNDNNNNDEEYEEHEKHDENAENMQQSSYFQNKFNNKNNNQKGLGRNYHRTINDNIESLNNNETTLSSSSSSFHKYYQNRSHHHTSNRNYYDKNKYEKYKNDNDDNNDDDNDNEEEEEDKDSNKSNRFENDIQLSKRSKDMIKNLLNDSYDCMICHHKIGVKDRIWTCKHCWVVFHLNCTNNWAKISEKQAAEAQDRPMEKYENIHTIRCPACNFTHNDFKYNHYICHCGKLDYSLSYNNNNNYNSNNNNSGIPHSCGEVCGRQRGKDCPHPCTSICHPGPCDPCPLPSQISHQCACGKMQYKLKCGQEETQPRLCGMKCDKLLNCNLHTCQENCHHGPCKKCQLAIRNTCFCGKEEKEIFCGDGIKIENNKGEIEWKFTCNQKCNKLLECGHHYCTLLCHSGSCLGCPRKVVHPTMCACGKTKMPKAAKRTSCLDPLPTCDKKCDRMLSCEKHFCTKKCHDSDCGPCTIPVQEICRCQSEFKKFKCSDFQRRTAQAFLNDEIIDSPTDWIRCRRVCKKIMSCGIHTCNVQCCKGRNKSIQEYSGHLCTQICNKTLSCKKHQCPNRCHHGSCAPCGVTYRNGLSCACGNETIPGPLLCGTVQLPKCTKICNKYRSCGHPCTANCHYGKCPPCSVPTSKQCATHNIEVHNIPCYVNNISCGNTCGLILPCDKHECKRSCHIGPCVEDDEKQIKQNGCDQICGETLLCGHPCLLKCHPSKKCDESQCKKQVNVKCICGAREEVQYCQGRTTLQIKAIPCNSQCQVEQRNQRFREAFNININNNNNNNNNNNVIKKEENENKVVKIGNHNNNNNNESSEEQKIIQPTTRLPYSLNVLQKCLQLMGIDIHNIDNNNIRKCDFVINHEELLSLFIQDDSTDLKKFQKRYPNITINTLSNSPLIHLPNMTEDERFIIHSMLPHFYIEGETQKDSKGKRHITLRKNNKSIIPKYLLSQAIIEYQKYSERIETLESCPPECMIVVDDALNLPSSIILDRLQAWSGDYNVWRTDDNQLFLVFTNESLRNSALTEMSKFGGRKATAQDSVKADEQKKKQAKKKKSKKNQNKEKQTNTNKKNKNVHIGDGWINVGDTNINAQDMINTAKNDMDDIKIVNRYNL